MSKLFGFILSVAGSIGVITTGPTWAVWLVVFIIGIAFELKRAIYD